uniref:Uncharacterized protein n=1 Tax=Physcomitrium patens TaxID=3218 RepID=A0A2K1ILX8_PHYPA|nr:hypothetical protein PHYPA_026589 [Physcomitrium patens]
MNKANSLMGIACLMTTNVMTTILSPGLTKTGLRTRRLITRGTIEEKVYHRQIYKHFLINKILCDLQQCHFFKARDMRDLHSARRECCNKNFYSLCRSLW